MLLSRSSTPPIFVLFSPCSLFKLSFYVPCSCSVFMFLVHVPCSSSLFMFPIHVPFLFPSCSCHAHFLFLSFLHFSLCSFTCAEKLTKDKWMPSKTQSTWKSTAMIHSPGYGRWLLPALHGPLCLCTLPPECQWNLIKFAGITSGRCLMNIWWCFVKHLTHPHNGASMQNTLITVYEL